MNLLWFLPLFLLLYMSLWFVVSLIFKRRDVVDVAWGLGFVFLIWLTIGFREAPLDNRSYLILFLISLWGLRLFFHTFRRNLNKEEDWRYHHWREGKKCLRPFCVFFQVFLFQAALMMIIALPAVYSLRLISLPLFNVNYIGIALMIVGLLIEAIADEQRYNFLKKSSNKNKLMMTGLWRYSRHPNYFGEILFWFGLYFLVFGAPNSFQLIISPLVISYVLLFVSGLPMEKRYRGRVDFEKYKERTSTLIPWFPKKVR